MKVQSNKTLPPRFTPITTSITFETQEEFDTFKQICGYAWTVSETVQCTSTELFNRECGTELLYTLYYHLDGQQS